MEILQLRSALYSLLGGLYWYPVSLEKLKPLLELESEEEPLQEGLALLRRVLREVSDWPAFLEEVNVEYTRLFEGPGFVPAPPYASFYLNGGLLMGSETMAVRQIYLKWGVAPVRMDQIPDDHITLELAFMGYLSGQSKAALYQKDDARLQELLEAQAGFLRDHLLTWVPRFCSEVVSAAQHGFFVGLSRLTQAFVESDRQWIEGKHTRLTR